MSVVAEVKLHVETVYGARLVVTGFCPLYFILMFFCFVFFGQSVQWCAMCRETKMAAVSHTQKVEAQRQCVFSRQTGLVCTYVIE